MATPRLEYKAWLKKSGRRSSAANARAWAKWAGVPAPTRRGRNPAPPPRTRGPGVPTPRYSGYGEAVDPSYGGTPLGLPADAGLVWTGASNPDLAEIGRGGYINLTPRKRTGGGWDVYGNLADPTPQWGKDYLQDLRSRERRHMDYIDQQVAPWTAHVLGSAQNANNIQQTQLANMMAGINVNAANAAPPMAAPVGMTGAGSGAGMQQDVASQQAAGIDAGARTAEGAYGAAIANLSAQTGAQGAMSALTQGRLRLPGQYEQMRMDFSAKLGEITEGIKENQRAREFQRQQLLEQRRQFGITTAEAKRAARAGEDIQREALDLEEATAANDAAQDAVDAVARTLPQIRSSVSEGEFLLDNKGRGWEERPSIAKYHGKSVSWEQAQNGRWYGVAGAGSDNAGDGNSEARDKYMGRFRDYSSKIPNMLRGKIHPTTSAGKTTWNTEPGSQMSILDVARDMLGPQGFKPKDAWTALKPHLMRIKSKDPNLYPMRKQMILKLMFNNMAGNNSARVLKLRQITGYDAYDIRKQLGLNPNAGAV